MTGVCGWLDTGGSGVPQGPVTARLAAVLDRDGGARTQSVTANWGCVVLAHSANDGAVFQDGERLVGLWGVPRFADPQLAGLARERGAAFALAHGYRNRQSAVLQLLSGDFALAIIDRAGGALLAVDRMGTRPLYYRWEGRKLVFASMLEAIAAVPGIHMELRPQAIYEYVYFHVVPGPHTIYEKCSRVLPGHYLSWSSGELRTAPYWQMRFTEDEHRPFGELKEEFRGLVRESVARAAQGNGAAGAFLSGGTDSSTVAGMMREVTGEAPRTYSIGFAAEGYDEMHYARIAARHFRTDHHEYYITPEDVVGAIPLIAGAHDQPFGNSSAVPTYYCAKLAKQEGVRTMLGGDGGDELFGGNERYAKQYLYSLYSDLPRFLRKGLIEPALHPLPERIALIGKAKRYIRNASQPMPARYDNYNLLERLGADAVFTPEFLETVDREDPPTAMADVYWSQRAESMTNRMLGFDLKYTLADNDLPKVVRSCELAGVDVHFPLLDDALVVFAARLPPRLKVKGTRLRYFFKEALRGFLPDEILAKTKHGFGLPFGPWLREFAPLRQIAYDSLADLKKRGILRPAFIDELTSRHVEMHAQYYGTMVWILMMLERWFQRSSDFATVPGKTAALLDVA